jgi:uncharacterized damage-inducible protein DinB
LDWEKGIMPAHAAPLTDESSLLLAFLNQQRNGLRYATYGLTEEQARLTPSASALSLGGVIKHVASVERWWVDCVVLGKQPESFSSNAQDYESGFRLGPDESLEWVVAEYESVAAHTESVISEIGDMERAIPVPKGVPWFPTDVEAWSLRWVLLHLIEETARHAGQADVIRESLDGATMHALQAAAEGWPETEWLKPWKPKTA